MALAEEAVSEDPNNNNNNDNTTTKKKKRKVGLAVPNAETVKRVVDMGQKARLLTLKKMKQESGGLPLKMGLGVVDKATRQKIAALGGAAVKASFDVVITVG
jgi:hypothetical protein